MASKLKILSSGREVYSSRIRQKNSSSLLKTQTTSCSMQQHVKQEANKFLALQNEYFALDTVKREMEMTVKNYQQPYLQNSPTEERMFAMNEVIL